MDDIVLRGIAKWPNVPAVYGWLSLDRRGNWRIKGEPISNPNVVAFIARNYGHDDEGRWFFQNGPQRTTKTVTAVTGAWLDEAGTLLLQTEHGIGIVNDLDIDRVSPNFVDSEGRPLDDDALIDLMEHLQKQQRAPLWLRVHGATVRIEPVNSGTVPQRFGFVSRPAEVSSQQ